MFGPSDKNSAVPSFLRLVIAVECSVVLVAGVLLFFLPVLAADVWTWTIPPFNSRFVGAVYLAAYLPLILFWFVPRRKPGWFTLCMIFIFTTLVLVTMLIHTEVFEWDRLSTFIFWPLYIFLPINSAIFLWKLKEKDARKGYDGPAALRIGLWTFALLGIIYGCGLMIAPEALTRFWPWQVDAFHARMYAAAFVTPAVAAWILSTRPGFALEYLSLGLNLIAGGFLPVLGTLWTNMSVPVARQVNFSFPGTWIFFIFFFITGIFGIFLTASAIRIANKTSLAQAR